MYVKLAKLLEKAGMLKIDFSKKLVAIKIHFGEPGNLSYIRPNYAAVIVKIIQEQEGLVFLTDANTLYKGRRSNAVDHLLSANENGFNPLAVGCNVVIADGLKGTDYREVEIGLNHCKTAKIGAAIANADVVISMNHFKGHEFACIGGCLKNIGMGSGSVGGKLEMHSNSKPAMNSENCTACRICEKNCAHDAIHVINKKAVINYENCVGCGQCVAVCQYDAVQVEWEATNMQEKIAEYAFAAVKDKPAFHVNFLMDISPNCDCWNANDVPIVPNIGILASSDPVAIDKASIDLVNTAPVNINSALDENLKNGEDKFRALHPQTDWKICLDYAEKIGLGSQVYELIKV
jgi:hypothetical protein